MNYWGMTLFTDKAGVLTFDDGTLYQFGLRPSYFGAKYQDMHNGFTNGFRGTRRTNRTVGRNP